MHFGNTAEWLAFTCCSPTSVNVVAIAIFHSSGGCERLKVGVLSKVFAMVRTHRHDKSSHINFSFSYRRNKSVELFPLAMLVRLHIAAEALGESVPPFLGHNCKRLQNLSRRNKSRK